MKNTEKAQDPASNAAKPAWKLSNQVMLAGWAKEAGQWIE
jgi:hypothetical protein